MTPHIFLSRIDKLDAPDQLVFDLDPQSEDFELVRSTALAFRKLLDDLELPAYLKTTGSRGLHVVVPLQRREGFDSVREFARELARIVVRQAPGERTMEPLKAKRGSSGRRIFGLIASPFGPYSTGSTRSETPGPTSGGVAYL